MLKRKIKLVAGSILLVLLGLGVMYILEAQNARLQRQNFSDKLAAEVERKRSSDSAVEIRLKDLTDFEWDRVHIFPSYTPHKVIDDDLGFVWQPARQIDMSVRDDVNLMVFTEKGRVVFYVAHSRGRGDFDGAYKREGYSLDKAIFTVMEGEQQPDGRAWLRLGNRDQ
jgi:hypothetical protein